MAEMTLAEIEQAITDLRAAKMSRLTKGTVTRTQYGSGASQREFASLADLDGEIARLELLRRRLTGQPTGNGPITIGFGRRI